MKHMYRRICRLVPHDMLIYNMCSHKRWSCSRKAKYDPMIRWQQYKKDNENVEGAATPKLSFLYISTLDSLPSGNIPTWSVWIPWSFMNAEHRLWFGVTWLNLASSPLISLAFPPCLGWKGGFCAFSNQRTPRKSLTVFGETDSNTKSCRNLSSRKVLRMR